MFLSAVKGAADAITASHGGPFSPTALQREDALQSCRLAFLEAHRRFDPNRGVTIGAYARMFVRASARSALEQHLPEDNVVRLSNGSAADQWDGIDDGIQAVELADDTNVADDAALALERYAIDDFLASLPPQHRDLLIELFWRGKCQADIARDRAVTRTAINRQLARIYERGREVLKAYAPVLAA